MKVIILAAGQGTRLRPHTDNKPKCMVELAGQPMLHRQLQVLNNFGVNDVVLVGGYKAEHLDNQGVTVVINPDYAETNMVCTLFCAEEFMSPGEDLLITYGDIIYEPKVLTSLLSTDADIVISIDKEWQRLWETRMDDPLSDAETLKITNGNKIIELGKKPNSIADIQGQYMGLIKIRGDFVNTFKKFWHGINRDRLYDGQTFQNMYMTSFLQLLIDAGYDARAAFTEGGWLEVDTVEDLNQYQEMHDTGELNKLIKL